RCSGVARNETAGPTSGRLTDLRFRSGDGFSARLVRIHADAITPSILVLELHDAIDQCKDREVVSDSDVRTGMPLRSTLAQDDVARATDFSAVLLHAAILRIAVASVARRADAFLVSHDRLCQPSEMLLMRTSVKPCRCPCLRA